MMEAVSTSETSVFSNVTTRRYIPDGYQIRLKLFTPVANICTDIFMLRYNYSHNEATSTSNDENIFSA
jgi:hypothetical protein